MMEKQKARNKSRQSLFMLMTWYACNQTEASTSLQHRVGRAHRRVDYAHSIEGRPRGDYDPYFSTKDPVENPTGTLFKERLSRGDEDEVNLWHYHVGSSSSSSSSNEGSEHSEVSEGSEGLQHLSRKLYRQFIGQNPSDEWNSTTNNNVTVEYDGYSNSSSWKNESVVYTSSNATQVFQPLRIRAVLAEENQEYGLSDSDRNALFYEILSPALLSWSSSLRVDPVVGNLTVDVKQLVDGSTCGPGVESGLPSLPIPEHHLTEGVSDTDMIVYLSLEFIKPVTTVVNVTNATGVDGDDLMPTGGLGRRLETNESALESVAAIDNTLNTNQTLINATTASTICSGDSLAASSFCSTDQYDRPTAALLHICVGEDFFDPQLRQRNIQTLMHELGHAMGFNALSMAHFRRRDGTPYTARNEDGDIPDTKIECTGPVSERKWASVALPSEEILRFREVRGGVRVAELVTPSVVQVVRNHFDCQDLTGAELESGEGLPLADQSHGCIGDHWERRLFSTDMLNPVIGDVSFSTRMSTLTLAYFADSGWYQVDLSNAEVAAGWGRGAGCGFVSDTCIGEDGEVPQANAPFFCNDIPTIQTRTLASEIHGCTADLSRKAMCSIGQYDLELPWEYQYFGATYGSDVGGKDALMDFCPVYTGFDNGLCSNAQNEAFVKALPIERFGERNSRCLIGHIDPASSSKTALCLPIACVIEDRSLRIKLNSNWHLCKEAGEVFKSGDVTVECPDPRRICPTFYCPYDCLGTDGMCDYETGKCVCEYPNPDDEAGQTLQQACGLANEDGDPIKDNQGPFLRPNEPDNDEGMPHPDSPLSDYYVPTTRALEETESSFLERWAIVVSALSGVLFVTLVAGVLWYQRKQTSSVTEVVVQNRNKDKMIATILVDLRINESLAETDEHLTESVANPSERSMELSSGRSDTLSDLDISQDDISLESKDDRLDFDAETRDEENECMNIEMQVFRRRKIAINNQITSMQES